ncbi:MAG TPA: thioesterase family protein [Acidimicrobiia bacterium]|nr:thioesterase family protein [Acidimicrobiia bacterium]
MTAPEFDRDAPIRRITDERFVATAPPTWANNMGRTQGGMVTAQSLMAMALVVDDPAMHPRSITTHFLRPNEAGDYEVDVTVERRGRTVVNLSARCMRDGRLTAMAIAVFGVHRESVEFGELPMPGIAPPDPGRRSDAFTPAQTFPFANHVVAQHRIGSGSDPDGPMVSGGWMGFADPRPFDAPGLAVLADAGMMPLWVRWEEEIPTTTVDYTVHFRTELPRSYPLELAIMESRTRLVKAGLFDWDATLWGPDGTVLCQARQQCITA